MRLKKFISGSLALGILLNSIPINSFASILSEDTRYETFEGSNITISDVLEEDTIDIKVEGNTLVNVADYTNRSDFDWLDGKLDNEGYIEITAESSSYKNFFLKKEAVHVKPSTRYTFFVEILENTLVRDNGETASCMVFGKSHTTLQPSYWSNSKWLDGGIVGTYKFTLDTKEDFIGIESGDRGYVVKNTTGKIKFRYMIIEGDHTDKDIDYFRGMKSVSEDKDNTIEIISNSKNIFDINSNVYSGFINDTGAVYENNSWVYHDYMPIKGNKKVTISEVKDNYFQYRIFFYDKNKQFISADGLSAHINKLTVNTPSNAYFYRLGYSIVVNGAPISREGIQVEYGEEATNYSEYNISTNKIHLNQPLKKINDNIKDQIVKINGQWYIERNIGEIKGSDMKNLTVSDSNNKYIKVRIEDLTDIRKNDSSSPILNNKFLFSGTSENYLINRNFENIEVVKTLDENHANYNKHKGICYITLSKTKASNLNEAKNWLNNSDLIIIYELANPIYEPIKTDLSVRLFEGTTHISNNSIIPATIEVTVDRTLNRAVEYTTLAKANPTIANLSRARYWTNLLKESTKKDELQEEINNNVDVVDLQLERKIASANLDLYIKCENMLSMSLDTNQISFDNFSGVEDLEKQNAIAISVNSSLPYQLNSYLVSEIQNSDKSKIMDKDILNIRENSDGEYKTFNDINEKLVLKDNIAQGNDNVHNIDLMLKSGLAFDKDIYKATIKLEAEQK